MYFTSLLRSTVLLGAVQWWPRRSSTYLRSRAFLVVPRNQHHHHLIHHTLPQWWWWLLKIKVHLQELQLLLQVIFLDSTILLSSHTHASLRLLLENRGLTGNEFRMHTEIISDMHQFYLWVWTSREHRSSKFAKRNQYIPLDSSGNSALALPKPNLLTPRTTDYGRGQVQRLVTLSTFLFRASLRWGEAFHRLPRHWQHWERGRL